MKKELVRRIDLRSTGATATGGGSGATLIIGNGDADKLDGFHASRNGQANTIPVLDDHGLLPAGLLPTSIEVISNISGTEKGARYIGPTAWLVAALAVDGSFVDCNGWIGDGDEFAVLQHYTVENEQFRLAGPPVTVAANRFRYPIVRGTVDKPFRGTTPQPFPAGAKIVSLGKKTGGGYMVENSGSGKYAPYLDVWINNPFDDNNPVFGGRQGNLMGLEFSTNPSVEAFRKLFPDANWRTVGSATGDIYLSGYINAKGGHIAGDMDVTGSFSVHDPKTPARVILGGSPSGFGLTLQNQERRPIWTLAAAYYDEETQTFDGDTLWTVEAQQERVIWLHKADITTWALDIGPFRIGKSLFTANTVDAYGFPVVVLDVGHNIYKFAEHTLTANRATLFGGVDIAPAAGTSTADLQVFGGPGSKINLGAPLIGLFGAEPIARPVVGGDRSDGTALVNLLTALESLGIIDDVTVA